MIDKLRLNARKPNEDEYGIGMLNRMNLRHKEMAAWGLGHIEIESCENILDVGCGGGQNIADMLKKAPNAKLWGIDYSKASVKRSIEVNEDAVKSGKAEIIEGSAESLPFEDDNFDAVTAFETVYYWPNIVNCFKEVLRTLKDGGVFLICNEDGSEKGHEEIKEVLSMNFYNENELCDLMLKAGFKKAEGFLNENGSWICAVGTK